MPPRVRKKPNFSVRFHKGLRFRCMRPGTWVTSDNAGRSWEIERRRFEPGCPSGWYVFGTGTEGQRTVTDQRGI